MKIFSLTLCLMAISAAALPGRAQPARPLVPGEGFPTQYTQTRWSKADGLPQSSVTAVLQARNGYLWLGTQEGVVRFDGHHFTVFKAAQHAGLPSNDVTALAEDAEGGIWVGTTRGLARWDGAFFRRVLQTGDVDVRALHARGRAVWVGTLEGLVRIEGEGAARFSTDEGLPSPIVISVGSDAEGRVWAGTLAGLVRVDGSRVVPAPEVAGEVRALHLAPDGRFFAGTDAGLMVLRHDAFVPFAPPGAAACAETTALTTDAAGVLWVGTLGSGLCALVEGQFYPLPAPELPSGAISALGAGAEGGVWVGMQAGGLMRLHRGVFLPFGKPEGLATSSVLTVLEGRDGSLWAGTDGGGLDHIASGGAVEHFGQHRGLKDNSTILSLLETRAGTLWAATLREGLCRLDGRRFRCMGTRQGLLSDVVYALHESADGTVWIGTEQGLNLFSEGRVQDLSGLDSSLAGMPVPAIVSAGETVWVAVYGGGVVRLENGRARTFGPAEGLTRREVLTLHLDGAGTLWAGLNEGGLCRLSPGNTHFRCYGTDDGLFDDKVIQILSDGEGFLWLGSNQGLVRIRLEDFGRYDAGRLRQLPVDAIGVSTHAGLRDPEVNGGVQPSAWRGKNGTLYFATAGGIATVTPGAPSRYRNRRPPPVYIEEVRAGDAPIAGANPLLPPRQRDLRFVFAAPSFQNPDGVQFRFRLEGHDDAWHNLEGQEHSYTYANLGAGAYTFRVQAANADGVWNETGAHYAFRIAPHVTETWWFWLLCGLAAAGAGIAFYRQRVRHLKRRQQELEAVVDARTREVRAREAELERVNRGLAEEVKRQLDVILEERRRYEGELITARDKAEESSRLKSAILNNMSHEIRTPIAAILGFSEILSYEVKGELQEFVQYIDENGKRLLATLNSVLDLSRIESEGVALHPAPLDLSQSIRDAAQMLAPLATRKGITLEVDVPPSLPTVADPFGVERIATNLVSNAIKFTEQGTVRVQLAEADGAAVLTVADTGVGIGEDFLPHLFEPFKQESGGLARSFEGSGLGLALVQRYAAAMGTAVEVESEKGVGSTFTVRLPLVGEGVAVGV